MHGKNLFYFFGGPSDGGAAGRSPQSPPSPPRQQASPLRSASNSGSGSSQEGSSQAASDGPSDAAAGVVVMHVHFGMSGAFKTMSLPGPDPTETTRLELINRVRCRRGMLLLTREGGRLCAIYAGHQCRPCHDTRKRCPQNAV